ncbi:hypothetical protein C7B06_13565 [Escherichia coli]|nr:hypothetical protein C7B06_13565 [Escherichia coli]PSZ17083.1 hypothetical protein C7B07_15375 [Escherichia coli]
MPVHKLYIDNDVCHVTITCNQSDFPLTKDGLRVFTERYIKNLNGRRHFNTVWQPLKFQPE